MTLKDTIALLQAAPADPIIGISDRFQKDPRTEKVNLTVGNYLGPDGKIPLQATVHEAQRRLLERRTVHSYLPIEGLKSFCDAVDVLSFGRDSEVLLSGRSATCQAIGGTGGLYLGGVFAKETLGVSHAAVPNPTWGNHIALFKKAGLEVSQYAYYDKAAGDVNIEGLLEDLRRLPERSLVLLQVCCHNPTGMDLSRQQWQRVLEVVQQKDHLAFLDMAYQGFAAGLEEDAWPVRLFAEAGVDFLLSVSLSKGFSIYGERTGTLCFVAGNLRKWITVRQAKVEAAADDVINVTAEEMNAPANLRILQDDEPASVYCDPDSRSFNTAQPLQATIEGGRLHLRFYSPRKLEDVEIWAKMPNLSEEEFLLARLDEVAPFIDFYKPLPFLTRDCTFPTASGKRVTIRKNPHFADAMLTLRATSYSDYWWKLQQIKHGWDISFSLYGGDPTKPDGGPSPNWIGIRPVHCREAVALFLNICYITDMKEHEEMIRANENLLYGNGGAGDPVTADRAMAQMREARSIKVGLVNPKHAAGLGGYGVFGLDERRYLNYNTDWGACTVMFHELGHVLGYNHSSSFTNGAWSQQLMSNFYLKHLKELPIDSPDYLDSKSNDNLYNF